MFETHLIEEGTRKQIKYLLKKSQELKYRHYNIYYNTCCLLFLVFIITIVLYYKYRTKDSPEDKKKRAKEKQEYIMSLCNKYNNMSLNGELNQPFHSYTSNVLTGL